MNLWLYSDIQEQYRTAMNLVLFGAETLKSALSIDRIDELEIKIQELDKGVDPEKVGLTDFMFSSLMDSIKITLFFENYFKAELIMNNFCVHKIKGNIEDFKNIKKAQAKRPIKLEEIHNIQPFNIVSNQKIITHDALEESTLGFYNLVSKESYSQHYGLDKGLLEFVKELSSQRNNLHFLTGLNFTIRRNHIEKLKKIEIFAQNMVNKFMNGYNEKKT